MNLNELVTRVVDEVNATHEGDGASWNRAVASRLVAELAKQEPIAWHVRLEETGEEHIDWDTDGWSHAWSKTPLYKLPEDV